MGKLGRRIFLRKRSANLHGMENNTKNNRGNILDSKTSFHVMEAYKAARTNIMFSLAGDNSCKKIVITGSMAGEGKTTTCINTAIAFSQIDARVLVIDADLRRPRVHEYLDLENSMGLSNVLGGFVDLDDVIITNTDKGFHCITAGHIPPNPAELLASKKMEEILEELSKRYDYIFLDTPPVTVVTEAAVIAKFATGVILVARQKHTTHDSIASAISNLEFADIKILGFILNDAEVANYSYRKGRYGYYSYGRKGYYDNRPN